MEFILFVGFGIAAIVWLIALMDWYARKKDRTTGDRRG
jgi:TRAP-type C4-dicarboxylate transport system permease small subunit